MHKYLTGHTSVWHSRRVHACSLHPNGTVHVTV